MTAKPTLIQMSAALRATSTLGSLSHGAALDVAGEALGYSGYRPAVGSLTLEAWPLIHDTLQGRTLLQRLEAAPPVQRIGPIDTDALATAAARLLIAHDIGLCRAVGVAQALESVLTGVPNGHQRLIIVHGRAAAVYASLRYATLLLSEQFGSGHGIMYVGREADAGLPRSVRLHDGVEFYWPSTTLLDATKWLGSDRSATLAPWPLWGETGIDLAAQVTRAHLRYRAPITVMGVIGGEDQASAVVSQLPPGERWDDVRWLAC